MADPAVAVPVGVTRPLTRPAARALVRSWVVAVVTVVLAGVGAANAPVADAQEADDDFPELEADQRVYDLTGDALGPDEIEDLRERLGELRATGADPVVMVRALDATPEATLEQVEALQQAWVAATGTEQDTAVAVLINRDPDDPAEARAGVFVGRTYDDGNVPRDEQEAIVTDALIPPLRDGDVHGALAAAVDRLASSIRSGPPQTAFERWAAENGAGWLVWAALVVAAVGLVGALALFRRRETTDRQRPPATLERPDGLAPAVAATLVAGTPRTSAVPATLLDLATRGALAIEPEREKTKWRHATVQVRLLDGSLLHDEVEVAVWEQLSEAAEGGLVDSKHLTKLVQQPRPVRRVLRRRLRQEGWDDPRATTPRALLVALSVAALVLALFMFIVAAVGGTWLPVVGLVAFVLLAAAAGGLFEAYSPLSRSGQEAALPWRAYRDGLKQAAKDDDHDLDLDATLADLVAFAIAKHAKRQLEAEEDAGRVVAAFRHTQSAAHAGSGFPAWAAFTASTAGAGGGAGGVASGGGAGGGGGAAGGT